MCVSNNTLQFPSIRQRVPYSLHRLDVSHGLLRCWLEVDAATSELPAPLQQQSSLINCESWHRAPPDESSLKLEALFFGQYCGHKESEKESETKGV